jgi:hypothetical protein
MTTSNSAAENCLRWDDRTWQVLPPITSTDACEPIEVPQLRVQPIEVKGRYYIVFSLSVENGSETHSSAGQTFVDIYYMVANNPKGSFSAPKILSIDSAGKLYKTQLLQDLDL